MPVIALIVGVAALLIGVATLWLAIYIYRREHQQLVQLKEITTKMSVESRTRENVKKFFPLGQSSNGEYRCIYPVFYYKGHPLPSIVTGDYYALQVLVQLFGEDQLSLKPIPSDRPSIAPVALGSTSPDYAAYRSVDAIYLCTPSVNGALRAFLPPIAVDDHNQAFPEELDLPCWFAEDKRSDKLDDRQEPIKKLYLRGDLEPNVVSRSEPFYVESLQGQDGDRYEPSTDAHDYGILLRLTDGDRKVFVIAGIHQFGTWIVASFLDSLMRGKLTRYRDILETPNDFLGVIQGHFNSKKLRVRNASIESDYFWIRDGGAWTRHHFSD